jgi:hypothetical protein
MNSYFSHPSYEAAKAAAKALNYDLLNKIIVILEQSNPDSCDKKELFWLMSEYISSLYESEDVKELFLATELVHQRVGDEQLKKIATAGGSIFFELCPSIYNVEAHVYFVKYFVAMGLENEVYLYRKGGKIAWSYPVHYICSAVLEHAAGLESLKCISSSVLEQALLIQDEDGCTPLHVPCVPECELDILSYEKMFEHLDSRGLSSYNKALLIQDNKGRTPMHVLCEEMNCVQTILYLLVTSRDTYIAHKSCAIKDNEGRTPYDLCLKNEWYSTYDEVGTVAVLAALKHLENYE